MTALMLFNDAALYEDSLLPMTMPKRVCLRNGTQTRAPMHGITSSAA